MAGPSAVAQSKRQASPSPEASPSKRSQGNMLLAGLLEIHIFLLTSAQPQPAPQETMEQSLLVSTMDLHRRLQEAYAQSEWQWDELVTMVMDQDRARQDQNVVLAAVREQKAELEALRAQVVESELRVVKLVPGEGEAVRLAQAAK
ncbi:hypothetical protein C0993_012382 [Termitomyces sp. T159_Od127]|nr:hypothetical protein C0993_012382 [Termitomyces sp. T159_Od127]